MKILFLISRIPFPPQGGDRVRAFYFLKELSQEHSITLVSFIEDKQQQQYARDLKKYCAQVELVYLSKKKSYLNCLLNIFNILPFQVCYYFSGAMRKKIKQLFLKQDYDCVFVELFRMAHYVEKIRGIYKILDLTDAISWSLQRSLVHRKHVFHVFYFLEMLKVKRYEAQIINKFNTNVLISAMDHGRIEK